MAQAAIKIGPPANNWNGFLRRSVLIRGSSSDEIYYHGSGAVRVIAHLLPRFRLREPHRSLSEGQTWAELAARPTKDLRDQISSLPQRATVTTNQAHSLAASTASSPGRARGALQRWLHPNKGESFSPRWALMRHRASSEDARKTAWR